MYIILWYSWYLGISMSKTGPTKTPTSGKHWQSPCRQQPQEQLLQEIPLRFLTPRLSWRHLCSDTCNMHLYILKQNFFWLLTFQLHLEKRFPSWCRDQE